MPATFVIKTGKLDLTLTSVVQKNKSCNKENFSMLQLFLLIL